MKVIMAGDIIESIMQSMTQAVPRTEGAVLRGILEEGLPRRGIVIEATKAELSERTENLLYKDVVMPNGYVCNAAKLHDALKVANETADELLGWVWNHYQELNCMGDRLKRAIEGVLAAPPRNCDRFGTDNAKASLAYEEFCDRAEVEESVNGAISWLLSLDADKEGGAK